MLTSDTTLGKNTSLVRLYGLEIEVERRGRGQPLLVLCGEEALELDAPVLVELAKDHELIIPSPPGFGASERPEWIESPDDIAYIYLDLAQSLGLRGVPTIGFSFGGWLALEMATKDATFCAKLVLVDPYRVKIGGPADRDIADPWNIHPTKAAGLSGSIRKRASAISAPCPSTSSPSSPATTVSFARFCWDPCLHNPKLMRRLHRVRVPTLFVWVSTTASSPPTTARHSAR